MNHPCLWFRNFETPTYAQQFCRVAEREQFGLTGIHGYSWKGQGREKWMLMNVDDVNEAWHCNDCQWSRIMIMTDMKPNMFMVNGWMVVNEAWWWSVDDWLMVLSMGPSSWCSPAAGGAHQLLGPITSGCWEDLSKEVWWCCPVSASNDWFESEFADSEVDILPSNSKDTKERLYQCSCSCSCCSCCCCLLLTVLANQYYSPLWTIPHHTTNCQPYIYIYILFKKQS